MASISKEPNGRRTIQFVGADGKRRSIRLGKVTQQTALQIKGKVEALVAASITGDALSKDTAVWLADRDDVMIEKLAAVGLVPGRESAALGKFLDDYLASRIDVKPTTLATWKQTRNCLVTTFGADKPLRTIDVSAAEGFKTALLKKEKGKQRRNLSPTTVQKRVQAAREFFSVAHRRGLISANPFTHVKARAILDPERTRFVTREETGSVIQACPDAEWRLIVALSRYGGLRCPSEVLSLRWQDIDWGLDRMAVQSPKGERHGKGVRSVPLFPELRPYLEEAFALAEPGAVFVIERNRKPEEKRVDGRSCNYRTRFEKIIRRAGLSPWPRVFHNLRASRETELAAEFPLKVVTEWLGNTPTIAMRHYLMATEADFQKAVQNPVQQPAAKPRNVPQEAIATSTGNAGNGPDFRSFQRVAAWCENPKEKMAEVNGNRTHLGPLRAPHWF